MMFYYILVVILLLSFFIFTPNIPSSMITVILVSLLLYCRFIITKLTRLSEKSENQHERINELSKKLTDMRSLTKTLKYNASVEERNRIAARIHDQVGHGISGSIIMLEASILILKDNPQKALESIQKAVANLRGGVEEIRLALREERVERYLVGMNDINGMLEEFGVSYNKSARLITSGNLDCINLEIWACIHDNTKECLTNLLKHSNAGEFMLNIEVYKKLIKVEYKDNGSSEGDFEKGLGLEGIEERTIRAKGKCFFQKGERGFWVTNIFPY
jgi:signal transduction histidine kinase